MTAHVNESSSEHRSRLRLFIAMIGVGIIAGTLIALWWCDRPVVVGFGDSITKGRNPSSYRGSYLDYFPAGYEIVNLGRNGESTEGGLPRLRAWLRENDADLVIIMMGTNDVISGSPEDYDQAAVVERLGAMIRSVQERHIAAVLVAPPPIVDPNRKLADERLARLAPRLSDLADALDIPFVDLYSIFSHRPNVKAAYVEDGVHPNHGTGNALIADRLLSVAAEALNRRGARN